MWYAKNRMVAIVYSCPTKGHLLTRKERFMRFMAGRCGADQRSRFLNFAALALIVISTILGFCRLTAAYYITWVAALVLMGIVLWRMFSKNTSKRYQENVKYLNLKNRVTGFFRRKISRIKQCKTHRFFKCPKCGQVVRTPKGKGTIRITCPKCRETFVRKH